MKWDASRLCYYRTLRQTTQSASGSVRDTVLLQQSLCDQASIAANPQATALRDSLVAHADFARLARFGLALRSGMLSVTADAQFRLKAGLDQQSTQLLSAGAEYRLLGIIPLRVGASSDFAGATMLSAGTGLQLLGINLDASVASISGTTRPGVRVGFGVGLIW
jgi:anti-sigma factor RsiW